MDFGVNPRSTLPVRHTSTTCNPAVPQSQTMAVLGKNIWGSGPSSFGRQQRLSDRTNIKNWGLGKIWGPVPPGPKLEPPMVSDV